MDELIRQLLEAELAKVQKAAEPPKAADAPASAPAPSAPVALDIPALVAALAPAITASVEAQVAKALPITRGDGVGPKGGSDAPKSKDALLGELVKKAADPEQLSVAEKRAIWALTYAGLRQGLQDDPKEK